MLVEVVEVEAVAEAEVVSYIYHDKPSIILTTSLRIWRWRWRL